MSYPENIPADVCNLFESIAMQLRSDGFYRYSADSILHRIRWHMNVERGDREYKCNNNWTAALARWMIENHPEMGSFFELRRSPNS